jgi:hypothetical protein
MTTGSTGKASLAQSLREPGIEHAAQIGLVQILSQDALGHARAATRQCLAQQATVLEDAMAQGRRSVLEENEIHRVRAQALARVAEQGEALSPAGVGVEPLAKNHRKIDVRPGPVAASRPRAEQIDRGELGVATPGPHERVDSIVEIPRQRTLDKHVAIVMPDLGVGRGEKWPRPSTPLSFQAGGGEDGSGDAW